jgi:hypothetical protein
VVASRPGRRARSHSWGKAGVCLDPRCVGGALASVQRVGLRWTTGCGWRATLDYGVPLDYGGPLASPPACARRLPSPPFSLPPSPLSPFLFPSSSSPLPLFPRRLRASGAGKFFGPLGLSRSVGRPSQDRWPALGVGDARRWGRWAWQCPGGDCVGPREPTQDLAAARVSSTWAQHHARQLCPGRQGQWEDCRTARLASTGVRRLIVLARDSVRPASESRQAEDQPK